jgi:hypothetical protein
MVVDFIARGWSRRYLANRPDVPTPGADNKDRC